jgi:hypothetical protein
MSLSSDEALAGLPFAERENVLDGKIAKVFLDNPGFKEYFVGLLNNGTALSSFHKDQRSGGVFENAAAEFEDEVLFVKDIPTRFKKAMLELEAGGTVAPAIRKAKKWLIPAIFNRKYNVGDDTLVPDAKLVRAAEKFRGNMDLNHRNLRLEPEDFGEGGFEQQMKKFAYFAPAQDLLSPAEMQHRGYTSFTILTTAGGAEFFYNVPYTYGQDFKLAEWWDADAAHVAGRDGETCPLRVKFQKRYGEETIAKLAPVVKPSLFPPFLANSVSDNMKMRFEKMLKRQAPSDVAGASHHTVGREMLLCLSQPVRRALSLSPPAGEGAGPSARQPREYVNEKDD